MDKKYLKETHEMFLGAELQDIKESECMHVKVKDLYKIAEQFMGEDHVGFIADHSQGEAEDNLRKFEFIQDLIHYNSEYSMAIQERIKLVNALRRRHLEIEEQEDELDKIANELESEEDAIKSQLNELGLVPEEEEEEEEIYNSELE